MISKQLKQEPIYERTVVEQTLTKHDLAGIAPHTVQIFINSVQGGITCGAIDEPRKSSKAIDERVIINFRDKNGVIARFLLSIAFLFYRQIFCSIESFSVLSIAFLFLRQLFYSIDSHSDLSLAIFCSIDSFIVLSIAFLFY